MLEKIRGSHIFWRKVIVYSVVGILAVAMSFVVIFDFKGKLQESKDKTLLKEQDFIFSKEQIFDKWHSFQKERKELEKQLENLEGIFPATSSFPTKESPTKTK